ncbi:MAG: hydrogenase iron-sulfur subunit, partial [Candidatus Eremiobacteraeota bacterium]|nr:hydrogenase iron-sulfur subunit [Candidatus Eremiobacteraeota bacterium]
DEIGGLAGNLERSCMRARCAFAARREGQGEEEMVRNDCWLCTLNSLVMEVKTHPRITIYARSSLKLLEGEAGNFKAHLSSGKWETELEIGSVIIATGLVPFDASLKSELGWGRYPDVLTSVEFEKLLFSVAAPGGVLARPSDGKQPEKIAFLQCVGSRDLTAGASYCSSVCCQYAAKEAMAATTYLPGVEITIFYIDLRAHGKDWEHFMTRVKEDFGVRFKKGMPSRVTGTPGNKDLILRYEDAETGEYREENFDMVVLSVGLVPGENLREMGEKLGISLCEHGLVKVELPEEVKTSREGILAAGAVTGPCDIPEAVARGSAASSTICEMFPDSRAAKEEKKYPPERDVTGKDIRLGIFIRDGVPSALTGIAREIPHTVHVEEGFKPDDRGLMTLRRTIAREKLNRILIAGFDPDMYNGIFRDALCETGLNPYLLEITPLSEVGKTGPVQEKKAEEIIRRAAARAINLKPLYPSRFPVTKRALVIGAGITGLNAALSIARQGFPVTIIEREPDPGGFLRKITRTPEGMQITPYLKNLLKKVRSEPNITLMTKSTLEEVTGHVGDFTSYINTPEGKKEINHGVLILATGTTEYQPSEYFYGRDKRVLTQSELMTRMATGNLPADKTVVMIQCIGSRNDEHPYCSRTCCAEAIRNALDLKEENPERHVYILHRDIRTYGLKEDLYRQARESGVNFLRFDPEMPPEVEQGKDSLNIKVYETQLRTNILINTDYLVLSTGSVPNPDNKELAEILDVTLDEDGFFISAQEDLNPQDMENEGMFVCGSCYYPVTLEEAVTQAKAAAGRACTILSKDELLGPPRHAVVDPDLCASCLSCVRICPYSAPFINDEGKAEILTLLCRGCGTCVSECPTKALRLELCSDDQILAELEVLATLQIRRKNIAEFSPMITVFCCGGCGYPAIERAVRYGFSLPDECRIIRIPCSGKLDLLYIFKAFEAGSDGVAIAGCPEDACKYETGSQRAQNRVNKARALLSKIGIEPERLKYWQVPSSMSEKFSRLLLRMEEELKEMGPLFPSRLKNRGEKL